MKRVSNPTAAPGNLFANENAIAAQPATQADEGWWNTLLREVVGAIEGEDIALAKPDNGQLADAVASIYARAGGGWQGVALNGAFQVSTRYGFLGGYPGNLPASQDTYVLDRWYHDPATASVTVTQVELPVAATGFVGEMQRFGVEVAVPSNPSDDLVVLLAQDVEDVALWATRDVVVSGHVTRVAGDEVELELHVEQEFDGSAAVEVATVPLEVPASSPEMTYFEKVVSLPSVDGKTHGPDNRTRVQIRATGAATYRFAGLQARVGGAALPYQGRPLVVEQIACARYYERSGGVPGIQWGVAEMATREGMPSAELLGRLSTRFRAEKRVVPTITWRNAINSTPGEVLFGTTPVDVDDTLGTSRWYTGIPRCFDMQVGTDASCARADWTADAELS